VEDDAGRIAAVGRVGERRVPQDLGSAAHPAALAGEYRVADHASATALTFVSRHPADRITVRTALSPGAVLSRPLPCTTHTCVSMPHSRNHTGSDSSSPSLRTTTTTT